MEQKQNKKSLQYYIRCLHRDIGFVLIGLTIIYALSGILLMYRTTGFLQTDTTVTQEVAKGLNGEKLGKVLGIRRFQEKQQNGDVIIFNEGSYNQATGIATYTKRSFPPLLEKFIKLHKLSSDSALHLLSLVYAVLLLFLALSSLFMFKPGTRPFGRGMSLTAVGMVLATGVLFLC